MKFINILLLYFVLIFSVFSQQWSAPSIIYSGGNNRYPSICVDNNGSFHCAWAHKMGENYWKIYYSKSTDFGLSWSATDDVLKNNSLWMSSPKVISDSYNKIHIVFQHNVGNEFKTIICHTKFEDEQWINPDTVSYALPKSEFPVLVIDKFDKIHCFWIRDRRHLHYRTFVNNTWGDIKTLFEYPNKNFMVNNVIRDKDNNIHCIGFYRDKIVDDKDNVLYFNSLNNFTEYKVLEDTYTFGEGNVIGLLNDTVPCATWSQRVIGSNYSNGAFSKRYDSDWSLPKLVSESGFSQNYGSIVVDSENTIHIVQQEKTATGSRQVHYQKNGDGNWEGIVIAERNVLSFTDHSLFIVDSVLFLLTNECTSSLVPILTIKSFRLPLKTENEAAKILSVISPNPFTSQCNIDFNLEKSESIQVKVYNLQGQVVKTLLDTHTEQGSHSIVWDGTNESGSNLPAGNYIVLLKTDKRMAAKQVVKM